VASSRARGLLERVAADPVDALERWAGVAADRADVDPLGARVLSLAEAGHRVDDMASAVGLSARQLHRRCLPVFGYGPRRLSRILRFGRALETAREGVGLADVAALTGYADQAHLARETRDLAGTTLAELLRGSADG
jgi:AraC-like DNA-binding protein